MRAFLFDLDGTLVDSLSDIAEAMNQALCALGHPARETDEYRLLVGEGLGVLVAKLLPAATDAELSALIA